MAKDKTSFVLYSDQRTLIELLSNEQAGKLLKHIFAYINDEHPICEDQLINIAFEPIKQQFKRDLVKWEKTKESRSKAGLASAEARKNNKLQQTSTNVNNVQQDSTNSTVNVNVNVNDNVNNINNNIDSRKLKFANSLKPFLDTYGKETLNDFYGYWTEHGENDRKMRFEKQTSFDIKRRLTTWTRNDKNKTKVATPDNLTPDVLYIMKSTGLTYEQLKG